MNVYVYIYIFIVIYLGQTLVENNVALWNCPNTHVIRWSIQLPKW